MNHKTVVLNAAKMNFDGNLDFSVLSEDVTVYDDTDQHQLLARIQGAAVVVTKEMPVGGNLIRQFPDSVKLICEAGTGYNNLDLEDARLNLSSSMQLQMKMLARGCHDNFTKNLQVSHVEVNDKVLGIIGAGNIGREVIKIAQAMDMKILAHTRTFREDADGVHYVDLPTLLRESDYVSLHCPLTPETRHLINRETLSMMKPPAFLINTSRGALVDEPALIEALKTGVIAGAGLDVQETEPPLPENPLYTMDNVILTPHMGWKGLETRKRLVSILAGNIEAYFQGMPVNVVS